MGVIRRNRPSTAFGAGWKSTGRCGQLCHSFRRPLRTDAMSEDSRMSSKTSSPLSSAVGEWINTLRDQWLGEPSQPLHPVVRCILVFLGSVIFFSVYASFVFISPPGSRSVIFLQALGLPMALGILICIPALIIAFVAGWRNERHGPIRLFLTGIVVPAVVSLILWQSLRPWLGMNVDG